jgi:hypothetical protein
VLHTEVLYTEVLYTEVLYTEVLHTERSLKSSAGAAVLSQRLNVQLHEQPQLNVKKLLV